MGETSWKKFPPHPFQELSDKRYRNRVVSLQIDGRREVKPRFCSRERLGTAKTLSAKRVVFIVGATIGRPFFILMNRDCIFSSLFALHLNTLHTRHRIDATRNKQQHLPALSSTCCGAKLHISVAHALNLDK